MMKTIVPHCIYCKTQYVIYQLLYGTKFELRCNCVTRIIEGLRVEQLTPHIIICWFNQEGMFEKGQLK